MARYPESNAKKYDNGTTVYVHGGESSIIREFGLMPDFIPAYLHGGGTVQPWIVPVYGMGAEIELIDMMYSMVRLLRPKLIMESGCHRGFTTYALGRAAQDVEDAHVMSCDNDLPMVEMARQRCAGLPVEILHCSALDWEFTQWLKSADFVFLDADEKTRPVNLSQCRKGALVVIHDTAWRNGKIEPGLEDMPRDQVGQIDFDETWRGFTILRKC